MNPKTITGRIALTAMQILDESPEGVRWSDLQRQIKATDSSFHPKTVNGVVWLLAEKFPDKVYKPEKGLFRSVRYKDE